MGRIQETHVEFYLERPEYREIPPEKIEGLRYPELKEYDLIEIKHDGIWGQAHVQPDKQVIDIYSRTGKLKKSIDAKEAGIEIDDEAGDFILHGEYMHGSNWGIRNGVDGKFFAFDIDWGGHQDGPTKNFPLWTRRNLLYEFVNHRMTQSKDRIFNLVRQEHISTLPQLWKEIKEGGYEGVVLKSSWAAFGKGWARVKRKFEIDYVVIGFKESNAAKYKGRMVKSIEAGLYVDGVLKRVCSISGINEEQRAAFYQRPEDFIGRVFTASGKGVFSSGSVRHPNFERWHQDKLPHECTLESALKVGGLG